MAIDGPVFGRQGLSCHALVLLLLLMVVLLWEVELCTHATVDGRFYREVAGLLYGEAVGQDVVGRCCSGSWSYLSKLAILLLLLLVLMLVLVLVLVLLLLGQPGGSGMK